MIEKLKNDSSKLVYLIASNKNDMARCLTNMITPHTQQRVFLVEDIKFFLTDDY